MDTYRYHILKKQEFELQTQLTEVKRQLVEMEWNAYLKKHFKTDTTVGCKLYQTLNSDASTSYEI